ncbi:MAG: hypothetical protein PHI64_12810 [Zoogloea sp.]|uniref:hypothetical protein n=1 Tax=Zoogloea sp. TaxID=49181 RepID=UPI0026398C90|nr:hypothetical protein [Zoogloea sp.]MDD2989829.1 hypothetical protein [Zoogloea sp.]
MAYAIPLATTNRTALEFAMPRQGIEIRFAQVVSVTKGGQVITWRDHLGVEHPGPPASRWIASLSTLPKTLASPVTADDCRCLVELSGAYPTLQDAQAFVLRFRRSTLP